MPNIPDKLYKVSIFIGLFLTGFFYLKDNESYKEYESVYHNYDDLTDSLSVLEEEIYYDQENFKRACDEIEFKYDLDSIYYISGDHIIFSKLFSNDRVIQSDMLMLEGKWSKIRSLRHKEELLNIRINKSASDHDEAKKELISAKEEFESFQKFGLFLIAIGIAVWFIEEKHKQQEKIKQFDKIYNSCQSCGNRFNSLRLYGKNQDGSFNLGLCKDCYDNGSLKEVDLTIEIAYKRYCSKHNIKNGIRKYIIWWLFNKLERWR
jgi:ribosomal protein S14